MNQLNSNRPQDRLSELPESLIFRIFWLLPMRDVVRTTILSKHWKNLWTTAPGLNFDYDDTCDDMDTFRDFVNRALICWEGFRIQKFKIDIGSMASEESFFGNFEFWVYFAMRKKVQELYLHNSFDAEAYSVPQDLYSCSSLQVLSLVNLCLEKSGNVQWNQLRSLTINEVEISEDVINQVLCGSPQLEVFVLILLDNSENLSIRSSSLKRLSIDSSTSLDRELRIWTPNLETLEILGVPCKYFLMDVSSLTHVTLEFCSGDVLFDEDDLHREALRQILSTIRHVEKVTLSNYCLKILDEGPNEKEHQEHHHECPRPTHHQGESSHHPIRQRPRPTIEERLNDFEERFATFDARFDSLGRNQAAIESRQLEMVAQHEAFADSQRLQWARFQIFEADQRSQWAHCRSFMEEQRAHCRSFMEEQRAQWARQTVAPVAFEEQWRQLYDMMSRFWPPNPPPQ